MADPPRYNIIYTENASKNRAGGLVQLRVQNKVVPIDFQYLKPCSETPKDPKTLWFTSNPIGKNTLAKMVKG